MLNIELFESTEQDNHAVLLSYDLAPPPHHLLACVGEHVPLTQGEERLRESEGGAMIAVRAQGGGRCGAK
jgi:hypothetical protein